MTVASAEGSQWQSRLPGQAPRAWLPPPLVVSTSGGWARTPRARRAVQGGDSFWATGPVSQEQMVSLLRCPPLLTGNSCSDKTQP